MSFCEIWHLFPRAPMRNLVWCYYKWLNTSLALKNVKKNAICFKLFWYKGFVHWKLISISWWIPSKPGGGGGLPYETDGEARRLS